MANPAVVIHGGAGLIGPLSPEQEVEYQSALTTVVHAAVQKLNRGDEATSVVIECVRLLEDSPLFNAGKGSVLTADGTVEMDACIMDGRDLSAGALASVSGVKNPILGADKLRRQGQHVLLCGKGAETFCREQGLPFAEPAYFITESRRGQLEKAKAEGIVVMDHDGSGKYGTVGAVCCDMNGNLAAATSTGGITNKFPGRVGDSPIPGAGTFAANGGCAVSATGQGESLMRVLAASGVYQRVKHGMALDVAAKQVIFEDLQGISGSGGLIAVNAQGQIATPFNTKGMFRAYSQGDAIHTAIYAH